VYDGLGSGDDPPSGSPYSKGYDLKSKIGFHLMNGTG